MNRERMRIDRRILAPVALCLGLATSVLVAAEEPRAFGGGGTGGDTVGSLPMMAGPNTGPVEPSPDEVGVHSGPAQPSFSLVGAEESIQALIIDAYPLGVDASFERVPLANGNVRYQFNGRMGLVLDRTLVAAGAARAEIVTGTSFHGGVAQLSVAGHVRAQQALLAGAQDMRLATLDQCGALAKNFVWHAISLADIHRVIAVKAVANQIRIEQRD